MNKETRAEKLRERYRTDPVYRQKQLDRHKRYRDRNKEKWNGLSSDYYRQHKDEPEFKAKQAESQKKYYKKWYPELRRKVIEKVSRGTNRCARCGSTEDLAVNHMNHDGSSDRKKYAPLKTFYTAILTGKRSIEDLNILCEPCNWMDYIEYTWAGRYTITVNK
jgi:5-methylcytosine-specific restriction endonuclease McrA